MQTSTSKNHPIVLLGVTGSIAAYKAAEIASRLVKEGVQVHAILTACAQQFLTPLTLQTLTRNPVTTSLFDNPTDWHPGHISLADRADLLAIAPATANIIAKLALGLADDALSTTALATTAPLLIAPAMNGKMWLHPATQQNVQTLLARGAHFLGPDQGMLACGYEGIGKLWPAEKIAERILELLAEKPQP